MIKIWHLLTGITLWTIGIERNDRVFNQEHAKVKQRIWDELIIYAKAAWNRVLEHTSRLVAFRQRQCFKALTKLGELGTFYLGEGIYILSGIGKDKVGR